MPTLAQKSMPAATEGTVQLSPVESVAKDDAIERRVRDLEAKQQAPTASHDQHSQTGIAAQEIVARVCEEIESKWQAQFQRVNESMQDLATRVEQIEASRRCGQGVPEDGVSSPETTQRDLEGDDIGEASPQVTQAPEASAGRMNKLNCIDRNSRYYSLKASIWDLALLCGLEDIGWLGSLHLGFCALVNLALQLLLCMTINDIFTVATVDDKLIEDLGRWRLIAGHDYKFVDGVTQEGLARRICRGDGSVPMSSAVVDLLALIDSYLPEPSGSASARGSKPDHFRMLPDVWYERVGQLMCLACVTIWFFTVVTEVRSTVELTYAVWHMPGGTTSQVVHNGFHAYAEQSRYQLLRMKKLRKTWCAFVIIVKFLVEVVLLVAGTWYLLYTVSVTDLLLNATALVLVMCIDEMIYASMAPLQAKQFLKNLQPLAMPSECSVHGLDFWAATVAVALPAWIWAQYDFLSWQADRLQRARHQLCGDNVNFLYYRSPLGTFQALANFDGVQLHDGNFIFRAAKQLRMLGGIADVPVAGEVFPVAPEFEAARAVDEHSLIELDNSIDGSSFSMKQGFEKSIADWANAMNSYCVDLLRGDEVKKTEKTKRIIGFWTDMSSEKRRAITRSPGARMLHAFVAQIIVLEWQQGRIVLFNVVVMTLDRLWPW